MSDSIVQPRPGRVSAAGRSNASTEWSVSNYTQLSAAKTEPAAASGGDMMPSPLKDSPLWAVGWRVGWWQQSTRRAGEDKDKEDALKSQQRPTYLSPSGGHVRGPGRPPVLSLSIVRLVWGSRFRTHTSVFRLCAPDDGRWGRGAGSGNAQVMSTRVRACKTIRERPVFACTPFITATVQHGSLTDKGTRRQQELATNTKLSFPIFFKLRLILFKHWDEFKSISLQRQAENHVFMQLCMREALTPPCTFFFRLP